MSLRQVRGFTLIELVVVLLFMGLASAIVVPNLSGVYDRFVVQAERDKLEQRIRALGMTAYNQRREIVLDSNSASKELALLDGWTLYLDQPIIFKSSGFCLGGELQLTYGEASERYRLDAPFCQPQRI